MNPIDFIMAALVAFACGTLGQFTYSRAGWLVNVAFAFIGALVGAALSRSLNAPAIYNLRVQATEYPIIYSIIGSVLFVAAIGLIIRPGRRS